MKWSRWITGGAAALALAGGGWAAFRPREGVAGPGTVAGIPVLRVVRETFSRRVTAEGALKAVNATPVRVPGENVALKIGWIAEDGIEVAKGDVVVRLDPSETRKLLALGESELATTGKRSDKERAESGAALGNLSRDADHARRELDTARTFQRKDPELFSRNEIIEADIDVDLAGQRETYARSSHGLRTDISAFSLGLLGVDARKADLKVDKARKELAALEVTAPSAGLFLLKRSHRGEMPQVGQAVWSGQVIGEIPEMTQLEAEVWVLEADAGGLAVGRAASVRLEAHPDVEVTGKVKSVDALARPRLRGVPVQYFGAVVELSRTDARVMKPGERVTATLVLGEEKNALAVPRHAVLEKDGKKIVHVRRGGRFEPVEVKLGASAVGRVVVTEGLKEGDIVALADPAAPAATPAPKAASPAGPVETGR